MLSILSSKESLLDLSINELRKISWRSINISEFEEELKNEILIERMRLAYKDYKVELDTLTTFSCDWMPTQHRAMYFEFITKVNNEFTGRISEYAFYPNQQYSPEFMAKYITKDTIEYEKYYAKQKWVTPDLFDKFVVELSYFRPDMFFSEFTSVEDEMGGFTFAEWYTMKDGKYKSYIDRYSEVFRYAAPSDLEQKGIPIPDHYSTVLTEQRIMSNGPCDPGQRAYAVWLKKYRRSSGDKTGFPTWGQLMELFKKHPKMDRHGYVGWIFDGALFRSENDVSEAPEHLSIQYIDGSQYVNETDDDTVPSDQQIDISTDEDLNITPINEEDEDEYEDEDEDEAPSPEVTEQVNDVVNVMVTDESASIAADLAFDLLINQEVLQVTGRPVRVRLEDSTPTADDGVSLNSVQIVFADRPE